MFDGNHSPVYLSEVLKRTCQISNFQGRRLELELYIKPQLSGGSMSWVEGVGYLASLLVFSSFFTKTMIPLRTIAIVSNVVFIIYGFFGHLNPTLILHILLLPLNVLRLLQMRKLIAEIKAVYKEEFSLEWMMPFMTKERFKEGDTDS